MRFNGRILILGTASDAVAKQLAGYDVSLAEAGELRTDVSTDEITPLQVMLNYDEKLAQFAHTGLVINGERPVAENALVDANIAVIVAGRRYGKGSSREHSPFAELSAGIRLVIAESFERIYRQNCDNLGIFTSTDFGLIDRIRAGEDIPIEELVADRDSLAADILRAGGLLAYGQVKLKGAKRLADNGTSPKTLAQKIISRFALDVDGLAWKMEPGTGGFVQADYRFIIEYYCPMAVHMLVKAFGHPLDLEAPDTIILFEDHLSYAHRSPTHVRLGLLDGVNALSAAHRKFADAYSLKNHGWAMEVAV